MKKLIIISCIFQSFFCFSQTLTININENYFGVDESRQLIICHIENIDSYSDLSNYNEVIIDLNTNSFLFNIMPNSLSYTNSFSINNQTTSNNYTLYFTELPLVFINSSNTIVDEPKVLASFTYADNDQIITSNIGIEIRGGGSQSYPKKTYDIEFWEDNIGDDTHNVQFKNLRNDDDWILDALYNEPLRLRSFIANKLWLDIHTPHYQNNESNAKAGADVIYAEMFLNGIYNGIYNISEQVDKKQLKIKSYNGNIRGELYKGVSWGASTFSNLPSFDNNNRLWSGYQMKYPKESHITDWQNIYDFTNFVINSSDTDFNTNVWNHFNQDNYLDYFIFLNLLRATDNTGKNIYIAKYNTNEPYFHIPWDLDGCFGTIWNGTNENITNDILTNGFHNRVIQLNPNNYTDFVSNRWSYLRNNILDETTLLNAIENKCLYLLDNKIYERETLAYPNYSFNQVDLDYILDWVHDRVVFLDIYFATLSTNESLFQNTKTFVFPNPSNDKIYIDNGELLNKQYVIYSSLGKIVQKGVLKINFIDIEKLTESEYILVINNVLYKFIKSY